MAINFNDFQNIALAISAYAQERWTEEKRINSTGIVSTSADINPNGESFIGQMRWMKPLSAVVNIASLSNSSRGALSSVSTDLATYIKTVRTIGSEQVNLQQIISKVDGLAYVASEFAKNRAQDEHAAVLSVLQGVAAAEAEVGEGVVDFDTMPGASTGAFVDINAAGAFGAEATSASDARRLLDTGFVGARGGDNLFRAIGMFWKDYEPDYLYLLTSPETLADFRAANLVDDTKITDGNLEFQTLFGGKFRIVQTRANQGNFSGADSVNSQSTKTTFLVKPGSIAFHEVSVPVPTAIDRNEGAYNGGGTTDLWYRYGFVAHPMGYDWVGGTTTFPDNGDLADGDNWARKYDPLNLGILPIFHS